MEAISNAGAAIGMLAKDGVVMVAEKKITSKVAILVKNSLPSTRRQLPSAEADWPFHAAAGHTCSGRKKRENVSA